MPRLFIAAAFVMLASAARAQGQDPLWAAYTNAAAGPPESGVSRLEGFRRVHGLPIDFWPDSALADSLTRAGAEGACGPMITKWVKDLRIRDRRLALDVVREFDSTGATLRQWAFPGNQTPFAIRGDALLLPIQWIPGDDLRYVSVLATRPDSSLVVESLGAQPDTVRFVECPPAAVMAGSDYWRCAEFLDLATGAHRHLAFNGICT